MQLQEITLAPQDAKVGIEIRILGNDAGEKLSILSGTLARLDRPAPAYGEDKYNDFNTFYYQAASGTSGGSSGSPVVTIEGKAIAIVAGGKKKAASSFYLPLMKPLRALQYLRKNESIPRGTIASIFRHCPYDEVHRLGLTASTEEMVRSTLIEETGMLVVDQVIPNGPAHNILEPGDVVVKLEGKLLTSFVDLESVIDSHVDSEITFEIERGGVAKTFQVKSQNIESVTPDRFLEIGGSVLHSLSYQQAKNHRLPVGTVYIAAEGYMFGIAGLQRGCIITSIGNVLTPNLDVVADLLSKYPDGTKVPIRYFSVTDRHNERLSVIKIDRRWHRMVSWKCDDKVGTWQSTVYPQPPVSSTPLVQPFNATPVHATGLASKIVPSLVLIQFTVPFVVDGGSNDTFIGAGVIVDDKEGLVVVDQNTVPLPLGDLSICFGGTHEVPGEVVFVHPVHNFAILRYDPKLLLNSPFKAVEFSNAPLGQGDNVTFVGLTRKFQALWQQTNISRLEELFIPEGRPPRFRAINEEVLHLEKSPSCVGGVLVDDNGKVQAFWASYSSADRKDPSQSVEFFRGYPAELVEDILSQLRKKEKPYFRSLEVELWPIPLSQARDVGLTEDWIDKIQQQNNRRHILNVRRIVANSDASKKLKTGDLLLAVDNKVCTTFREVEIATRDSSSVTLTLLRDQKEVSVAVDTVLLNGEGTTKIACWAGAILQNTHRAVAQLGFVQAGVYCSRWYFGSPSHKYNLRAAHWIEEVNGKPTPDLDTFLKVVSSLDEKDFVRLKIQGLQDRVQVITLKSDEHYWPTWVLSRKGNQWIHEDLKTHISSIKNE